MKTILIFSLLFFPPSFLLFGQSESGMAHLKLCKENTSKIIEVIESNIDSNSIVNIWIIPPMGCPRCEGVASVAMTMFRKIRPDEKHVVWIDRYSQKNLTQYLKDRNFPADKVLDSDNGILSNLLALNLGNFQTPHYLRYNGTKKEFTIERPLLGASVSDQWIQEVIQESDAPIEIISCSAKSVFTKDIKVESESIFTETRKYTIPGDVPEFTQKDIAPDRSEIILVDKFTWDVIQLQRENSQCNRVNVLNQLPLDTFISPDAPASIVNMMKKSGMINYMLFTPKYGGKNKDIYFGVSLPKIVFKDDELGYYNEGVFVRTNLVHSTVLGSLNKEKVFGFHPSHTQFYPDWKGENIYMKCSKGWPVSGTDQSVSNDSPDSPFRLDFYTDAPMVAISDFTGRVHSKLGRLDEIHAKTRTGYYYADFLGAFNQDTFFYTTGYSGKIYSQYSDSKPAFVCPDIQYLFNTGIQGMMQMADGKQIPILPSTDAPVLLLEPDSQLNYILKLEDKFKKGIKEFELNNQFISLIIQDFDKTKYWVLYERYSGRLVQRIPIPAYYSGGHLCAAMIGKDGQNRMYLDALYLNGNTLHWCSLGGTE